MPSLLHEALLLLFRNRPSLAAELMREALGEKLPLHDTAEIQEASFSQVAPTEYHADLVVLLRSHEPVFGIVVEVQLQRDDDKRYSWPLYAAALRAKLRCPACVLVICADQSVARWAQRPIHTGQPNAPFHPLVLGPDAVPRITRPDIALRAPELAILSTQAHGHEPGAAEIASAALLAVDTLEHDRAVLYFDLVWQAVSDAARHRLEEFMRTQGYEFQSAFAKRYVAEGQAEGLAQALLRILASRGLQLGPQQEQTVRHCSDPALLDQWIDRALNADSVEQVFRDQ